MTGFGSWAGCCRRSAVGGVAGCVLLSCGVSMETRRSLLGRLLGPLCCGLLLFVLLLLDGSASSETYAVDVEVKDDSNITCLFAKMMMNFSVTYESNMSEYKNKDFTLPENVTYDGSTCGDETSGPLLAIEFGEGNFWSISFVKTDDTYQGNITFIYNTNDEELFPDAKRKGPIAISANYPVEPIKLHTVYLCHHVDSVEAGNVTNVLWNISLQAFLHNGSLSTKYTHCEKDVEASADEHTDNVFLATTTVSATTTTIPMTTTTVPTTVPTTTESTTTTSTTTESTTTSTTTESTTTTSTTTESTTTTPTTATETTTTTSATTKTESTTTASTTTESTTTASTTTESTTTASTIAESTTTASTTTESTTTTAATDASVTTPVLSPAHLPAAKTVEKPVTGNYSVNVGATACLLASMGLQLNISREQGPWIVNIQPESTEVTGNCGKRAADLRLNDSNNIIIDFYFAVKNASLERFYLQGVNITIFRPDNGSLYAVNNNLSYWDASLGSSYMCRKEETLFIADGYRIRTFDLRVQPFDVKENKFSTAEDCSPDVDNFFVPIVVAASLAGLVCLIFMAYFVGHRKRHGAAGYEQI